MFEQLSAYAGKFAQESPHHNKPEPSPETKARYLTTRISEYIKANPGVTAWQVGQAMKKGWKDTNMTLAHLSKMGVLRSVKKFAQPGCHAPHREFVKHYWRVE